MPMTSSLVKLSLSWALLLGLVVTQSLSWVNYPTQVITGQSYEVAWSPSGIPVTINLIQGGSLQGTLFSSNGDVTSFTWQVEDDDDAGTNYALQVAPVNGGSPIDSGPVWVIEDEDGLVVNGRTITASVSDGPTMIGAGTVASVASSARSSATAPITRTATITSAGTTLTSTFTTAPPTATADQHSGGNYNYPRGLGAGAIAGIVIGVVVVIAAIVAFFWFRRRRNRQRQLYFLDSSVKSGSGGYGEGQDRRDVAAASAPMHVEGGMVEQKPKSNTSDLPGTQVDTAEHKYQAYSAPLPPELPGNERHEMDVAPPGYASPANELAGEPVNNGPHYPSTCISMSRANTQAGNS